MKFIGAHVSAAGGVELALERAAALGANALALFTKNQRQWQAPPLTSQTIRAFHDACVRFGFQAEQILPHDSYLINLGHPEPEGLAKSREAFLDELRRCELLGLCYLNFHPGSHLGKIPEAVSLKLVSESINWALEQTQGVTAVIENTAGQGTNLGWSFEQLAAIIDGVEDKSRIGVCLDTCHVWDGGYDIVNNLDGVLTEFDRIIGLDHLKAIHLNDSLNPLGSHKDRHARIGEGQIGLDALVRVIRHPALEGKPFILETPNDDEGWTREIALLRERYSE